MNNHQWVLDPLGDPEDGHILTRAIIDTIREPLIVLDEELRIIAASQSFYAKFGVSHELIRGRHFYDLGNGEWNIPALRILLEQVIPQHAIVGNYEVVHDFITLGKRTMLVNACEIRYENGRKKMLLTIFDVTEERATEEKLRHLIEQKNILLKEMGHRIANSLQLIASILMLKAGIVESEEIRKHLEDAHERIMSVATVQRQLNPGGFGEEISVGPYLTSLCASLERSLIGGRRAIPIIVTADEGSVSSEQAISFGLLTTELVINAVKHGFPGDRTGTIVVAYTALPPAWTLSVSDSGIGKRVTSGDHAKGLGTSIVDALADQLQAAIEITSSENGTKVSFSHPGV